MKAQISQFDKISSIYFPVRLIETSQITGMVANPECAKSVVATIDNEDRILATCGDKYNLISNEEVYAPIFQYLDSLNVEYNVSLNMRNFSRFEVKINIVDERFAIEIENSDIIYPQISLNRSYDGGSKYNASVGYFRLICSNGLQIPYEGQESYSVSGKHTEKLSYTLENIMGIIDKLLSNVKTYVKKYEVLTDKIVDNYGDRIAMVMEATNIKKGHDEIVASVRTEAAKLGQNKITDWLIYNGINAHIFNNENNVKSDEVRKKIDQDVLQFMIK